MIPRVEDILIAELERRIVAAVPDTAPGDGLTPETFVTFVEERRIQRNVQEQNNLTVFCMVTAVISAIFSLSPAKAAISSSEPRITSLRQWAGINIDEKSPGWNPVASPFSG